MNAPTWASPNHPPRGQPVAPCARLDRVLARIDNARTAAGRPAPVQLLAVSKIQPAAAIRALADCGHTCFGENYVQEALAKQQELADPELEWHLIGPLQSNKARLAARHFDWVHSVDRPKLVDALARHRPADMPPLNVLIQVNIDDEASKSGCVPDDVMSLAALVASRPTLSLRGLMAIPAPWPDAARRRSAFAAMATLQASLAARFAHVDTLSMGMSADFEEAIAEGANLVRVGTALFGPRPAQRG